MYPFSKSTTSYSRIDDGDYEEGEKLRLGGDAMSRSNHVIIKTSFFSVLVITILLLSSIISTWVVLFGIRQRALLEVPRIHSYGPAWVCQRPETRREWRMLTTPERQDYVTSVRCLADKPSNLRNNGTLADDFAWIHKYLTTSTSSSHNSASFLPWHRYFVHIYEKRLRDDCAFDSALPYWDWSLDSSNFKDAPIWDSVNGIGGDGSGSNSVGDGKCVASGPFSDVNVMFYDGEVEPHCLSRGFANDEELKEYGELIRPESINSLMKEDRFDEFAGELEKRAHKFLTHSVRGDLSSFTGPNDPVFFLHHVNLDRLWWQWQHTALMERLNGYSGRAYNNTDVAATLADTLDMGGLARNIQVVDVMDTTGGQFCYGY